MICEQVSALTVGCQDSAGLLFHNTQVSFHWLHFNQQEMKQQMLENHITVLSPHEMLQLSMARHAYMVAVKSLRTEFEVRGSRWL